MYVKPNNSSSARANQHQVIVGDDVLALFNDAKKQGKKGSNVRQSSVLTIISRLRHSRCKRHIFLHRSCDSRGSSRCQVAHHPPDFPGRRRLLRRKGCRQQEPGGIRRRRCCSCSLHPLNCAHLRRSRCSAHRSLRQVSGIFIITMRTWIDNLRKLLPWLDGMMDADEAYFKEHGEPLFVSYTQNIQPRARSATANVEQ